MASRSPSARSAALLLAALVAACAGGPGSRSTGEHFDDAATTAKVKAALVRSEEVDAGDVQVETYKGIVQLSGFADDEQEARRAEDIARQVQGVRDVQNDIRLKPDARGQ